MDASLAGPLARFAAQRPLVYNDFASAANMAGPTPDVFLAMEDGAVHAAAIDDGVAMSVAGSAEGLTALARSLAAPHERFIISGRREELRTFVAALEPCERSERVERFMAVTGATLRAEPDPPALRVATQDDVSILVPARVAALREEYGIDVREAPEIHAELQSAVRRAVDASGIAIWTEARHIAFTAQLISKTAQAATFGDLYTDPGLRGAGRATRALTAFCQWLLSESAAVTLRVGEDNLPALRLYERVGFEQIDECASSVRPLRPGE
jgi:GNAT superfamily N-acetyltransferase